MKLFHCIGVVEKFLQILAHFTQFVKYQPNFLQNCTLAENKFPQIIQDANCLASSNHFNYPLFRLIRTKINTEIRSDEVMFQQVMEFLQSKFKFKLLQNFKNVFFTAFYLHIRRNTSYKNHKTYFCTIQYCNISPFLHSSSRGRVVKALDLKSNGLCPRRFDPCRLPNHFFSLKRRHQ